MKDDELRKEPLAPVETVTKIYLVRHGHTAPTEDGLLYSDKNADLTDEGVKQAKSVAEWIGCQQVDLLIAGSAKRVASTADFISKEIGKPVLSVDGFDEWKIGEWEKKSYWQVRKEEPEVYKKWSADPIRNAPPGGESIVQLHERIGARFDQFLKEHEGKSVVFVIHAGIIRSILVKALEMNVKNFWRINIPVGSISRVDFSKNFATVQFVSLQPE